MLSNLFRISYLVTWAPSENEVVFVFVLFKDNIMANRYGNCYKATQWYSHFRPLWLECIGENFVSVYSRCKLISPIKDSRCAYIPLRPHGGKGNTGTLFTPICKPSCLYTASQLLQFAHCKTRNCLFLFCLIYLLYWILIGFHMQSFFLLYCKYNIFGTYFLWNGSREITQY